ncbi:MAG: thiol-disulfide isomerase [Acidobacteria bacterium]|nr:thiol-disulfide isomerase [Acidobacteriota bacterium]MBI3424010.1 thiol-disulfide isomerase [Acidobacteriota bacterium]
MRKPSLLFAALFIAGLLFSLPSAQADSTKAPAKQVTFTKDVAPIFFKNCAQCHRPDDIAPFSVLSYKDVRPWAKSIKEQVANRQMPPWHADPHFGQFENEARLTQAEIDTVTAWVDGGAKEGSPKDLPPVPVRNAAWEIGQPDVVLQMPEPFTLSGKNADDYIYIRVPTGFTEDKWIQAGEFRPGNRKVVHHAVVFIETPLMYRLAQDDAKKGGGDVHNPISVFQSQKSSTEYRDGSVNRTKPDAPVVNDACGAKRNSGGGGTPLLSAYAPGRNADIYPAGMAKRIPAGSNLIFQMHYAKTNSNAETDRTSIALVFAKQPVEKMVETLLIVNDLFAIPPGAENHEANACHTLRRDVELINYMPHLHVRGKDMKYEIAYADGKRETLINVPAYDFNWQTLYKLKQPLAVPKGAKLIVTAHFDNSAKNKSNPDPTKTVRFGEPTYDEMLVGFMDTARPKPADRPVAKLSTQQLDAYVGEYSGGLVKFRVEREGNTLFFVIPNQAALPATPESETKFYFKDAEGAEVSFTKNEQGEVTDLNAVFGQQKIAAKRVGKGPAAGENK